MQMLAKATIPVLVVGAGPAGLVSALALILSGIAVRIIERDVTPKGGARGTAMMPRSLEIFTLLGIIEDVLEISTPPLLMAIHDAMDSNSVKLLNWSEEADNSPTVPYRNLASLSQAELERILCTHLEKYGVKVERGTELVNLDQNNKMVKAQIMVKKSDVELEESVDCEFVIAADGARGRCRKLLGIQFLGETRDAERMFTANVDGYGIDREHWHRWGTFDSAIIMLKPLNPPPLFQVQLLGPNIPAALPHDTQGVRELFQSISHRDDIRLENASWISEWKANIRVADRFSVGRVFLVGDAAHTHSPAGGQGTNTAIQDAINLVWKMALVLKGLAPPSILDTYEIERIPVVAEMLNLSTQLHTHAFNRFSTLPISTAIQRSTDPMLRSKQLLQLGVNYRWSPIALDDRSLAALSDEKSPYGTTGGVLRAGDRAPDAPGLLEVQPAGEMASAPRNLFGLFSTCSLIHSILVFTNDVELELGDLQGGIISLMRFTEIQIAQVVMVIKSWVEVSHALRNTGIRCFIDKENNAHSAYGVQNGSMAFVVIRPDGFIGAYVTSLEQVHQYFSIITQSLGS